MASRRKVSGYNPLSASVGTETNDTWVCMAPEKVNYYARADANSKIQKYVEPGEKLRAIKQGDWLSVLDPGPNRLESGLYVPVKNPLNQSERLFQNERMMLWERTRAGSDVSNASADGLKRMTSDSSVVSGQMQSKDGSQAWVCDAPNGVQYRSGPSFDANPGRLCEVNEQVIAIAEDGWLKVMSAGKETGTFLPMCMGPERLFHIPTQGASKLRAGSFRYVDSEGISQRLSQTPSEDVKQSEVWLCTAPTSIALCNDPACESKSSTYVKPGEKVNGIKEGPSIKVVQVTNSTDMADFIGRRSLKASSTITIQPTGMYLPFNDSKTGDRFFKNEKLILWEQAQNGDLPAKDEGGGGCSVM